MNPAQTPGAGVAAADDAALLHAVRAGQPGAFEQLMRRFNRRLYRVARSLLRDAAEAEDALQEAYLRAFRSLPTFRGDAGLATWLTRIVSNECLDRLRRQTRRNGILSIVPNHARHEQETDAMAEDPAAVDHDTPDRALQRAQLRSLLERKIDELPQDFRAVFVLRSIEELSVEETAQSLGLPESTVRTRHFRARSLLRDAIELDLDTAGREVFDFDGARCDRIVAAVLRRAG